MERNNDCLQKGLCCQYDPAVDFEGAVGALRVFVPAEKGYVNYNIVHSVVEKRNCNTWRLGKAFALDDALKNEYELTPKGAEWDMALRLTGRPDFIGGYAHGDEIFSSLSVNVDGKNVELRSLETLTPFNEMTVTVESTGYDPGDPAIPVLKHFKQYLINPNGILLNQRVEWLNDYTLESSYMAMMPPLKTLTDSFYTNIDTAPKEAVSNYGLVLGATEAVVFGLQSKISFSMSVPNYPCLIGGNRLSLTDNNGGLYNKMYFHICDGASVAKGDVWETSTKYNIQIQGE